MKLLVTVILALQCCLLQAQVSAGNASVSTNSSVRTFQTQGLVRELSKEGKTLVVRHDAIPGYMPKMTMELTVKNTNELKTLSEGDIIKFNLVVDEESHFIEQIQRIGRADKTEPTKAPSTSKSLFSELKPGDAMPNVELIDENGKQINLADFRGKAVAFTFIFSRCPLPDYCPRMNKHFNSAREILLQNKSGATNWQFLSISFDAEFDKPAVLQRYGDSYRASKRDRWLFAAISPDVLKTIGPRLDFAFSREGGSFSHNLRTVVLDPQGRIFKQFDNNLWSAEDLAKSIEAAALSK